MYTTVRSGLRRVDEFYIVRRADTGAQVGLVYLFNTARVGPLLETLPQFLQQIIPLRCSFVLPCSSTPSTNLNACP